MMKMGGVARAFSGAVNGGGGWRCYVSPVLSVRDIELLNVGRIRLALLWEKLAQ
jgi:hypothetical protein